MNYEIADSLLALRSQLDVAFPKRSRKSDGMLGDAAHQSRHSDHNPWWLHSGTYYVTAADFTHDPDGGVDCHELAYSLLCYRDERVKYVIWNQRIMSGRKGPSPWMWRPYNGPNKHTQHLHLSVIPEPVSLTSKRWNLGLDTPAVKDDDLPNPSDVWGFKVHDLYTPNPADTMTAGVALEWALRHAADARDTARRCEEKLDALIRKLGQS